MYVRPGCHTHGLLLLLLCAQVEIPGQALRDGVVGLLSLEERHVIEQVQDVLQWRPPVFELWLESAAEKQLLGLARFNSSGMYVCMYGYV